MKLRQGLQFHKAYSVTGSILCTVGLRIVCLLAINWDQFQSQQRAHQRLCMMIELMNMSSYHIWSVGPLCQHIQHTGNVTVTKLPHIMFY